MWQSFFSDFICCFTGAGERKNLTSHEDHHNLEKLIVKKWLIWFCFSGRFFSDFICCFTGTGERKNLTSHEDHHNLEKLIVKKWLIWFCFSGSGDGDHARWDNKLNKWLKKRTGLKNFYVQKMNFYTVWAWKLRVTIDRAFPIECLKTKPKYLLWKEEWKIPWKANENSE